MSNSWLGKAAAWAGILSLCLYAVDFFNLNPFKSNNNQSKQPIIVKETDRTDKESTNIVNKDKNPIDNSNNEIITLSKAYKMSIKDILLIPFRKHEKCNYIETVINTGNTFVYILMTILVFLTPGCIFAPFIFFVEIYYIYESIKDGTFEFDLSHLWLIICPILIFIAWYTLTMAGWINWF